MEKSKNSESEITKHSVDLALVFIVAFVTLLLASGISYVGDLYQENPKQWEFLNEATNPLFMPMFTMFVGFIFFYAMTMAIWTVWQGRHHISDILKDE